MALTREALAIDELDTANDSQYIQLSAKSQYAASGYIDVLVPSGGGAFASATLIAPDWVLTAAHAVSQNETGPAYPAGDVTFGQGASTTAFVAGPNSVSQVDVDPGFDGQTTDGSDLALLQLSTPITNVAPAVLYPFAAGTELGLKVTVVGYGYTGTGLTGYNTSLGLGTRRAATNTIDAFGGQITNGGPGGNSYYNFGDGSVSSDVMLTDFDDPNNPNASVMGSSSPTNLEGATVPGDSGGGAFVTVGGQTYLAGVTSFIGAFADNTYSTAADGHYGDFDGYTRLSVSDSQAFLDSELITTSSWSSSGGGTWASLNNWGATSIPEFMQATANFGSGIQSPSIITLDANWTVGTVTFNNTNSYTLTAGTGGTLTLDNGGATATAAVIDNGGSHFINAPIYLNSNVLFSVANSGDVLTLSGPVSGAGGVTIGGSGTVRLANNSGTTSVSSLIVQSGATLDITNNTLAINYGPTGVDPIASIVAALAGGYSGGTWTGSGIRSSTAAAQSGSPILSVGYADGNTDTGTPAAANQIIVKYTLAGDANLDGKVDFTDLGIVGQHLNTTGNDWAHGNFTYDPNGVVNFTDLGIVGQNLNKLLTPAGSTSEELGGSVVAFSAAVNRTAVALPEPAGLLMLGVGLLGLRRRRRA